MTVSRKNLVVFCLFFFKKKKSQVQIQKMDESGIDLIKKKGK